MKCTVYLAKHQNLDVPSIPLHVSSQQLLVIPLSQHYIAAIIVILWRQTVRLHVKANSVLYSMEI